MLMSAQRRIARSRVSCTLLLYNFAAARVNTKNSPPPSAASLREPLRKNLKRELPAWKRGKTALPGPSLLGDKKTRENFLRAGTEKTNRDHGLIPAIINPVNDSGTKDAVGNPLAGS